MTSFHNEHYNYYRQYFSHMQCNQFDFQVRAMAILWYLQPRNGLPEPKGDLSLLFLLQTISETNRQVQKAISIVRRNACFT